MFFHNIKIAIVTLNLSIAQQIVYIKDLFIFVISNCRIHLSAEFLAKISLEIYNFLS